MRKCLLVIVFALCVYAGAYAEEIELFAEDASSTRYAVDGNVLWYSDNDAKTLYIRDENGIDRVLYSTDEIRSVDTYQGNVYVLSGRKQYTISCLSSTGELLGEWHLPRMSGYPTSLLALEDHIVFQESEAAGLNNTLYVLEKDTGKTRIVPDVYYVSYGMARYGKDDLLFAYFDKNQNASYIVCTLDPDTFERKELGTCKINPETMAVDGKGDIYIASWSNHFGIHRFNGSGTEMLASYSAERDLMPNAKDVVYGWPKIADGWLYMPVNQKVFRVPIDAVSHDSGKEVLTIYSEFPLVEPTFVEAIHLFEMEHTDVAVRVGFSEREDLTLELMSGTAQYDIYRLHWGDQVQMHRAGLFADLSQSPAIMKSLEDWHEIGAMRDQSGALRVIPTAISGMELYVAPETGLLEEYGIELLHDGTTYDEYRALARQIKEKNSLFRRIFLTAELQSIRHPVHVYNAMYGMDYGAQEFSKLLSFWKQMFEEGLTGQWMGVSEIPNALLACDPYLVYDYFGPVCRGEYMYYPNTEGLPVCTIGLDGLYLYEYSGQKELAAEFLAIFASREVQKHQSSWQNAFLRDITAYEEYTAWAAGMLDDERNGVVFPLAGYEHWACVLKNSVMRPNSREITDIMFKLYPKYLSGEMTEIELISELREKADILQYE